MKDDVKFFIGPMSKNIVDSILKYSSDNKYTIGIIPSRRQVDINGGYVNKWTTKKLKEYINDNVLFERDHGGIGQGEEFDNGKISYIEDSKYFDIIHVDPWKYYKDDFEKGVKETIENIRFIHKWNPTCLFEVGTEEAIRYFTEDEILQMLTILKKELHKIFDKIAYCVVQSGTGLRGTSNIGVFDPERLKRMISICDSFGILSKEHNGDYLYPKDIKTRFDLGLSAINLAPEFGVFETDIILEHINDEQKEKFFEMCLKSDKWIKWVDNSFDPKRNKTELIRICGHYQFSTKEFLELNLDLDHIIKERLYEKIKKLCEI
jgi:hypothetical protein